MTLRRPWDSAGCEPSISDLLSDPIAQALMRADGIAEYVVIGIIRGLNSPPNIRLDRTPIDGAAAPCRERLAAGSLPYHVTEELVALALEYDPEAAD
jgi:hypothetical protein